MKKPFPFASTLIALVSAAYFLIPLYATFQFSLQMVRGEWSLAAYRAVFASDTFIATITYSVVASLVASGKLNSSLFGPCAADLEGFYVVFRTFCDSFVIAPLDQPAEQM